jgi:hypothetical protein
LVIGEKLDPKILKNIAVLLERVPLTGKEAIAWCEAVAAINEALAPLPTAPTDATGTAA